MRLKRFADIAFIICCVTLGGLTLQRFVVADVPAAKAGFLRTDPAYAEFVTEGVSKSVLLYLSPSCRFCTASMPLYRRLTDLARDDRQRIAIQFVSNVEESAFRDYLNRHSLRNVSVTASRRLPGVAATPTMLVLDPSGQVLGSWAGQLNRDQERSLLRLLSE